MFHGLAYHKDFHLKHRIWTTRVWGVTICSTSGWCNINSKLVTKLRVHGANWSRVGTTLQQPLQNLSVKCFLVYVFTKFTVPRLRHQKSTQQTWESPEGRKAPAAVSSTMKSNRHDARRRGRKKLLNTTRVKFCLNRCILYTGKYISWSHNSGRPSTCVSTSRKKQDQTSIQ
jgi:hypothetical protein